MNKVSVFFRLAKVDVAKRIVYGVAADETMDHSKEIFDYKTSKPFFEKWSGDIEKATDGKSLGNVRAMHGKIAAGKLEQINFDDKALNIEIAAKVVDDNEWAKVEEGVYTGFSIGGSYVKKWKDGDGTRYTCNPCEISLVDLPCIPTAMFTAVKADGAELRKYFQPGAAEVDAKVDELAKAAGKDPVKDRAEFEQPAREALAKDATGPVTVLEVPETTAEKVPPTNEAIVAKASEIAAAKGGSWTAHVEEARLALVDAAPAVPPVEKTATTPAPADKDVGATQVWQHPRLAGQSFGKKAELVTALEKLDAAERATALSAPASAALKALNEQVDPPASAISLAKVLALETTAPAVVLVCKAAALGTDAWNGIVAYAKAKPESEVVKALALELPLGKDGALPAELPAAALTVVKALADAAKAATLTPEQIAAAAKAGEGLPDGRLVLKTAEDVTAAITAYKPADGLVARRHIAKRARVLKVADKIPADWSRLPAIDKAMAPEGVKKSVSLYTVSAILQLLASLESYEESCECDSPYYDSVNLPAELKTRFGSLVVELGDVAASILDVILAAMRTEEAGEAMTRVAGALDVLKGMAAVIDPLAKAAGIPADVVALTATIEAERTAFKTTIDHLAKGMTDLTARLKAVEDTPLPPGTSSVTKTVDKTVDAPTVMDADATAKLLQSPDVLKMLGDAAIRQAHSRPMQAVPGGR